MKFVTQDYYEILNVAPGASNEEVKRAYRMVRKSFRPDSMAIHSLYSEEETEAISAKIDEAFRLLSDPESARRYGKYNRSGRAGMNIPRDPDQFFDLVHDLDGSSPLEELAERVAEARAERLGVVEPIRPDVTEDPVEEPSSPEPVTPQAQLPLKLTRRTDEVSAATLEAVAQAEVFIDSLEELPEVAPQVAAAAPVMTPRAPEPLAPAASTGPVHAPAMIRTPGGPQLGRRSVEIPVDAHARPDPTARALPGSTLPRSATTLATTPVAASPRIEARRTWIRDTIKTRAVGTLEIAPLPREELEAIEVDCGGVGGEYLQQVRRSLGVSLADIAQRTKIGIGMLRAMEADELDRLPARVYLKGYLTQTCRLLRLPVPQVPEKYLRRHGM